MLYLQHDGKSKLDGAPVGSGRYPLGSGERPFQDYQNPSKSQSEKLQLVTGQAIDKNAGLRARALESGRASELLKYRGQFSNAELQQAVNRLNLEKQLSQLAAEEAAGKKTKVETFFNVLGKLTNYANAYINARDVFRKLQSGKDPGPNFTYGQQLAQKYLNELRKNKEVSINDIREENNRINAIQQLERLAGLLNNGENKKQK